MSTLAACETHAYNPPRNFLPLPPVSRQSLRADLHRAKLALGRRMYAAGIDDGIIGAQIAEIDAEIQETIASDMMGELLRSLRNRLLIQLADAALEFDAPMPGAEAQFRKARDAETALADFDETAVYLFDQTKACTF